MEFTFSEQQEALRATARDVLTRESPMALVRERADRDERQPSAAWSRVVELGWSGTLIPERHDGLGLGMVDIVVVMEEIGRALYDGPFLSSAVLATLAARAFAADDLLAALATGAQRGAVALEESGHGDPLGRITTVAHADGTLHGTKPLVIDGDTCDWAIVVAHDGHADGPLGTYLVREPAAIPTPTLDITRRFATIEFGGADDRPAQRIGPAGDHTDHWREIVDAGAVALAAEMVGVAEASDALALDYAQAREAFGKPLSKFQVTRHKAVDLLRDIELARVAVHYAAWALDAGAPERADAVAMAKSYAAEAANHVTAECIQIHGGVGYTWECDAHLFLRRAKVDDLLLGNQSWWRERLAGNYFAALA
ncbi:MAG TPA: acyl-CoA dehydrogenase family protein [Acidimicrobiia bacterium]